MVHIGTTLHPWLGVAFDPIFCHVVTQLIIEGMLSVKFVDPLWGNIRGVFSTIILGSVLSIGTVQTAGAQEPLTGQELSPGTGPKHGIAMHGSPKMPLGFSRFPFVTEGAMKGGEITLTKDEAFDSLNTYIAKGIAWHEVRHLSFESLMMRSPDEPFTLYGLLAQTIETPYDRSWVEFTLNPKAKFSDGTPVTIEDVIFSMEILREKGRPNMRRFYSKIDRVETPGPGRVRFIFGPDGDREAPLLLGLMSVISKAYYTENEFEETSLLAPLGSGPYIIEDVDPGRSLTFERNPDYWGKDLAVNRGRHNFNRIKFEFYRDENSKFEAFKKGLSQFRTEYDPTRWAQGYDFHGTRNALVLKEDFSHGRPSGMLGFAFNTRRELFTDPRVREALIYTLDFEWMNKNFFFDVFTRTQSYFDNSELASTSPISDHERRLLAPYAQYVRSDIFQNGWRAPVNGNRQNARENAMEALALLEDAGWHIKNGTLVNDTTLEPFKFEILLGSRTLEKVALNYATTLKRLGIVAEVRVVDSSQFQQRRQTYDFDMIPFRWGGTLSPGNEQSFRWGSKEADIDGTFNVVGAKNPAIDAMIEKIVLAQTRQELIAATRALDRVLLSGFYAVPLYHQEADQISWWGELQPPRNTPMLGWSYGFGLSNWWMTSDN
jgi:peptide/nickel transport system substrate-binding protein